MRKAGGKPRRRAAVEADRKKAIELANRGWSTKRIAAEMKKPRRTVAEWIKKVVPTFAEPRPTKESIRAEIGAVEGTPPPSYDFEKKEWKGDTPERSATGTTTDALFKPAPDKTAASAVLHDEVDHRGILIRRPGEAEIDWRRRWRLWQHQQQVVENSFFPPRQLRPATEVNKELHRAGQVLDDGHWTPGHNPIEGSR